MTSPSLYQQEMAKRNIAIPKATGCPRQSVSKPVIVREVVPSKRGRPAGLTRESGRVRHQAWLAQYIAGATMQEIADDYGVKHQSVQQALAKLDAEMRPAVPGQRMKRMERELQELKRDNMMLRMRLAAFRKQEAA